MAGAVFSSHALLLQNPLVLLMHTCFSWQHISPFHVLDSIVYTTWVWLLQPSNYSCKLLPFSYQGSSKRASSRVSHTCYWEDPESKRASSRASSRTRYWEDPESKRASSHTCYWEDAEKGRAASRISSCSSYWENALEDGLSLSGFSQ